MNDISVYVAEVDGGVRKTGNREQGTGNRE
jgi:hypothetical protein